MDLPVNVLGENRESLEHFFQELGEQKYRAHQLMQWVYHYNCRDFAEITVFSKKLRNHLSSVATVNLPTHLETHKSHDSTVRWVLEASTGDAIETVLIPDGKRLTLCISSQAGCSLDCTFCATGKQGFNGNLSTADIVGQTFFVQDWLHKNRYPNSISNVVFMGMGEPLMNYEARYCLGNDSCATNLEQKSLTNYICSRQIPIESLLSCCTKRAVKRTSSLRRNTQRQALSVWNQYSLNRIAGRSL